MDSLLGCKTASDINKSNLVCGDFSVKKRHNKQVRLSGCNLKAIMLLVLPINSHILGLVGYLPFLIPGQQGSLHTYINTIPSNDKNESLCKVMLSLLSS